MSEPPLLADGFEAAIIGLGWQFNQPVVVYDRAKCLALLRERDGMSEDDAEEWMSVNVQGAFVGPATPIFVELGDLAFVNARADEL